MGDGFIVEGDALLQRIVNRRKFGAHGALSAPVCTQGGLAVRLVGVHHSIQELGCLYPSHWQVESDGVTAVEHRPVTQVAVTVQASQAVGAQIEDQVLAGNIDNSAHSSQGASQLPDPAARPGFVPDFGSVCLPRRYPQNLRRGRPGASGSWPLIQYLRYAR